MPLSRSEVSPQVPLELGPKCQIISEALLTSIDWMWSKPTELLAPVLGSHTACQVNLTSAVVIGVPSDQLRPGLSLTVTSMRSEERRVGNMDSRRWARCRRTRWN